MRHVALGALLALVFNIGRVQAAGPPLPTLTAPEAVVIDGWSDNVLYARNPDAERDPASTVKIMSALIVLERHIPLRRVVTVGADAASAGGSTAGLVAGERMTLRNLLYGMLLPSGNDAAYAVAEAVGGSQAAFVRSMNREARRLHLWRTHFRTPNGFDAYGQVTSALDLANLARVAMQRPTFAAIVRQRSWTAWSTDGRTVHHWTSRNELLWRSPAVDGVKTGTTPGAGANLVASARWGGKWVIAVCLGSTADGRFRDGMELLRYGLAVDGNVPTAR